MYFQIWIKKKDQCFSEKLRDFQVNVLDAAAQKKAKQS